MTARPLTGEAPHAASPEPVPDVDTGKIAQFLFELRPREITVVSRTAVTERLTRVRFTGDDLHDLSTVAPEDHVKLFFDTTPDGAVKLPEMVGGRWAAAGFTYRDYTVRHFDPDGPWLDIEFVLHGHGVAGTWAATAAAGDRLGMLGPRGAFLVHDISDWYVFAVDETALPAMQRWLEMLRPDVPVIAFVEVQDSADEFELKTDARLEVHWLHRHDRAPGQTDLLERAVRSLDLPVGEGFVWVAGEALSIKPLRRYLRDDLALDRDSWDVDGYWRRGSVNHDHHQGDDDD